METIRLSLYSVHRAYQDFRDLWPVIKQAIVDGKRLYLEVREEKRSDPQNRRLWAMLGEVSRQVDWHGVKLTAEEWKDVFSASWKKQRAVPGIDGGFVVLGARTSQMTKGELSEMLELIAAFGADRGVVFADEAIV